MRFLNSASALAFLVLPALPALAPMFVFRMIKMTILYGASHVSAYAFACYGVYLTSERNRDFDGGYRMGQVARSLMDKFESNEVRMKVVHCIF